jgi:hypothetical protein
MEYTVKRRGWFRGKGGKKSSLLLESGERCCIGFVGKQCGIPDEVLLGEGGIHSYDSTFKFFSRWPLWMRDSETTMCEIYGINDSAELSDPEREAKLKVMFAEHGDTIVFVG